ncbi:phytanoyl-CoA dioxygenase family protein [Roseibium sp. MMSF_3544]|uniref:phytanoyl-CoA dioxygenase family protein n=1 Tax=unclassified Roseibium TaxID=2629323 RepID=UPI00273D1E42|nr:phytanoyl-CoA dioxygenase family protein [Roseibium sp. MMSF_3544]
MDVLEEMDLRFHPARLGRSRRLTDAQIDQYNRLGFVQPFEVFTAPEIAGVRAYFDRLMEDLGPDGAYGINCYQARMAGIWDIATNPRILDLVQDIIGGNIICWASAILSKRAGDPKRVPWHQDASFWGLSPARTVTVWLAIDDVDEENAAMRFIPGSHDKGAVETSSMGENSVFHKGIAEAERFGAPVSNSLKAGQISLHADMLIHGSEPNTSARRRCGLTLRYCPPEVRIIDPAWATGVEAIVARGADPSGHWNHHPRPTNDDITKTASPHVVGNN